MDKLNPLSVGLATAITLAVINTLCAAVVALWPDATLNIINSFAHGLDLRTLKSTEPLDLSRFFVGLISIGVIGFIAGVVFRLVPQSACPALMTRTLRTISDRKESEMTNHEHSHHDRGPSSQGSFWSSRSFFVWLALSLIAAFLLLSEHRAHILGAALWLLILACPLAPHLHAWQARRPWWTRCT